MKVTTPLEKARTAPQDRGGTPDVDGQGLQGLPRAFSETTLVENPSTVPPESTPSMSEEEVSGYGSPQIEKKRIRKKPPTSMRRLRQASAPWTYRLDPSSLQARPPSLRMSEDHPAELPKAPGTTAKIISRSPVKTHGYGNEDGIMHVVSDTVAEAMQELAKARQRAQSSIPSWIVRQARLYTLHDAHQACF